MVHSDAAPTPTGGNPTLRTFVVVVIALFVLAYPAIDIRRAWHPSGTFGYGTNLDGVVTGVDPDSPAARAGMQVGDRLDESTMSVQDRWDLIQFPVVHSAGITKTFGLYQGGRRRTVALTSVADRVGFAEIVTSAINLIGAAVFIGIGVATVLLRPSPLTWAFYLFCLAFAPLPVREMNSLLPAPQAISLITLVGIVDAAGITGLIAFSLLFLQEAISGWRLSALRALPIVFVLLNIFSGLQTYITYFAGGAAEWSARAFIGLDLAVVLIVGGVLLDTYVHRRGAERQRIRWVVFGFSVALIANLTTTVIMTEATNTPFLIRSVLGLLPIIAPIAVAYAIVKHRVIDVNFVVSRTLVYGILTTFFVGVFAVIDWFVGHVLDQIGWALVAEIGAAVAIGFWLNALHSRVDRFVDVVLFRRRHASELRLARLARGLPHANSAALVDEALVSEPSDAMELSSAALFRRDDSGRFRRICARNWPDDGTADLRSDDPLILHLQAERAAIRLGELHWTRSDIPLGGARPVLALPILERHRLEAIAFYGAHRGGEDFDPDEVQWLNSLAAAAGAAYDHVEADALRHELERVRNESEAYRVALQTQGLLEI